MAQQQERYLIGPALRDKLRDVISRVDGSPLGAGVSGEASVRLQSLPQPSAGMAGIRLCKTVSQWSKGTTATLNQYNSGIPPNETANTPPDTLQNCVNKFANVGAGKWVIVSRAPSGYWYLISAECG